jgi:hypothetical protein
MLYNLDENVERPSASKKKSLNEKQEETTDEAETVRVLTVPEFLEHHDTWIACTYGKARSSVASAKYCHPESTGIARRAM